MMQRKKGSRIEWQPIELAYRTTTATLRELEAQFGVGYAHIARKAKKEGWTRDLRPLVRSATDAALLREAVAEKQRCEAATGVATSAQQAAISVVEAQAELNRRVITRHRSVLDRARSLVEKLLAEFEAVTDALSDADREALVAAITSAGVDPQRARALAAITGVGVRMELLKDLSTALAKLVPLERAAYSLDDQPTETDSFEDWLRRQGLQKAER